MHKVTLFTFLLLLTVSIQAEQVPGTAIDITPPAGFIASDRFPGYYQEETGNSILVTTLPMQYSSIVGSFNDEEGLAAQKMKLLSLNDTTIASVEAKLLNLTQVAMNINWEKWVVVLNQGDKTTMVTATFKQSSDDSFKSAMKSSITSLKIGRTFNPYDALHFSIKPEGSFEISKVMGQNVILAPKGVFPPKKNGDPYFLMGLSLSERLTINNPKSFAKKRMMDVKDMTGIEIRYIKEVIINGLTGFEIVADALDNEDAIPSTLFQTILYDKDGYVMIYGTSRKSEEKINLPLFEKMAGSFTMKN